MERYDSHGKQPVAGLVILFIKDSKDIPLALDHLDRLHALLLLVKQGQAQMVVNQEIHKLYPNQLVMVPQGRKWLLQKPVTPIYLAILGFDPKQLYGQSTGTLPMGLFQYGARQPHIMDLATTELHWLWKLLKILKAKIHPSPLSPAHGIVLRYGIYMLLWELDRLIKKERHTTPIMQTAGHFLVLQFMELLSRYYHSQHQVGFYAKRLQVTPDHLSRVLKKYTGLTAKEHISAIIMEEAKVLLHGPRSIKEIAHGLGFKSPYAFSKFFKCSANIAPSAYRKTFLTTR